MTLRISGKSISVGEALRDRVSDRTEEVLRKYFDGNYSGHITLSKDGFGFKTDCALHLDSGVTLEAESNAADAYASADEAALRMEKQGLFKSGRVRLVSITLDPATDRPEVLRRYAEAYGLDLASWHLLTGAADDVGRVVRAFGLNAVARERIVHGSLVVLVDDKGRIAERRTDLELDPERLMGSVRKLLG